MTTTDKSEEGSLVAARTSTEAHQPTIGGAQHRSACSEYDVKYKKSYGQARR